MEPERLTTPTAVDVKSAASISPNRMPNAEIGANDWRLTVREWRNGQLMDDSEIEQHYQFCERGPQQKIKWDRWVVWCVLVPLCIIAVYSVGTMAYYEFFHRFVK